MIGIRQLVDTPRSVVRGQRIVLPLILAAVFIVSAEARVISPLLPAIAQEFASPLARTGILLTAYMLPYGLFQLLYGPLADRFSRQRVMACALGLFAFGTFASGFAPSLLTLDLLRIVTGAAAAGVSPIALAYIADAVPYRERQAALGRAISVASLGTVLSAALGGLSASFMSWRVVFIGSGVFSLVIALILLWLPVSKGNAAPQRRRGFIAPYRELFSTAGRRAVALYGLVFYEGILAFSTLSYLGALVFERDHLPYALIGVLYMLNGGANILAGRLLGRFVRRFGERRMVMAGGCLCVIAFLLVGLQPVWCFFPLGMLLQGFGFVIAHSTLQTHATELAPEQRGTAVALFAFTFLIGGSVGSSLAGFVIEHMGFPTTLLGTAALYTIFTVGAWPLLQWGRKRSMRSSAK